MNMQETNETLGAFLKTRREESNVSIEQVAYATRISLKMLRALEEDDHTALPAPTFVRGYLQAYAKYVRMDTQDLLLRYQHHLATAPDSKKGAIKSHYLYVRERYQEKRRLVLVIVLFATMLSVAGTYFLLKAKRERNKSLAHQAEQIKKGQDGAAATATTGATTAAPAGTAPADGTTPAQAPATGAAPAAPATATPPTAAPADATKPKEVKPEPTSGAATPAIPSAAPAASQLAINAAPLPSAAPASRVEPTLQEPTAPKTVERQDQAAAPANANEPKAYNVLLKAEEDVWLRFQTDEEPVRDLTLREGKAIMLRANKVVKVFSGNLGALKATMNGQALDNLSPDKKAKSLVLPQSEAPNYKLPLFPQFQTKRADANNAAAE